MRTTTFVAVVLFIVLFYFAKLFLQEGGKVIIKESIGCYGSIFWSRGAVVACCCGFKRTTAFDPKAYHLTPKEFQALVGEVTPFNPREIIFEEGIEPPSWALEIIADSPLGGRPQTIRDAA